MERNKNFACRVKLNSGLGGDELHLQVPVSVIIKESMNHQLRGRHLPHLWCFSCSSNLIPPHVESLLGLRSYLKSCCKALNVIWNSCGRSYEWKVRFSLRPGMVFLVTPKVFKEEQHLPETASLKVWVRTSEHLPLSTPPWQHADNTDNLFSEHLILQTRCR